MKAQSTITDVTRDLVPARRCLQDCSAANFIWAQLRHHLPPVAWQQTVSKNAAMSKSLCQQT